MSQHIKLDVYKDEATGVFQVVSAQPAPWATPRVNTQDEATRTPIPEEEYSGYLWAPWGKDDRLPTMVREMIEQVPMAGQAITRLAAMMYGDGLAYYRNDDRNKEKAYSPKIEAFLLENQIEQEWFLPQLYSYRTTVNCFSEMIWSRDGKQITNLLHLDNEFSRLSRPNKITGQSPYVFYSAEFASKWYSRLTNAAAIPLIDWRTAREFDAQRKGYKAAWHSRLRTPGTIFYPTPLWFGLFKEHGWMENSAEIPVIVNAMAKNQIRLKYQILIPISYFRARYGNEWNEYDAKTKTKLMDDLVAFIEDSLTGTSNAMKTITTFFDHDTHTGAEIGRIEVIAIDDKLKSDSWVPSSNAADAQIVQGLGLHPSAMGLAPEGGKMGAGSGSDQREAWNAGISINTPEQGIVLSPLNFLARFNAKTDPDWNVTFYVDHTAHVTTDQSPDGLATNTPSGDEQ